MGSLVKPFLAERTRAKIKLVSDGPDLQQQLATAFSDSDVLNSILNAMKMTDNNTEKKTSAADSSSSISELNFTSFLTLFGEKLHGTDPEDVIRNAFKCFDPEDTKVIPGEELKRLLQAMGERFTKEEVEEMFNEQDCDDAGNFDYIEFTRLIKHGPKDEEE